MKGALHLEVAALAGEADDLSYGVEPGTREAGDGSGDDLLLAVGGGDQELTDELLFTGTKDEMP